MSKTVRIPAIGADPYVVRVNGKKYGYPAGTEQTVPDAVAEVIENDEALRPRPDPRAEDLTPATVGTVKRMIAAAGPGGGGEALIVTLTEEDDVYTADKTDEEIIAAWEADQPICIDVDGRRAAVYELEADGKDAGLHASLQYVEQGTPRTLMIIHEWGEKWEVFVTASGGGATEPVVFTLSVDAQTGTISGSTDADFEATCAAISDGKAVWGDVITSFGGITSHYRGLLNGDLADNDSKLTLSVLDTLPNNGFGAYRIRWTADGVTVTIIPLVIAT